MFQDKAYLCNMNLWRHRTEDLFYIVIFGLVLADYLIEDSEDEEKKIHRIIAAFMVIISCRIMMHTFARNPDVAIVSEMVDHIRSSLLKFFFSYIFIFLGWIVAFHVTLGTVFENQVKKPHFSLRIQHLPHFSVNFSIYALDNFHQIKLITKQKWFITSSLL